jgi:hypothetical protein
MAYSLQQSVNYALTYIQYSPLTVGTGNEPAISIANEIQNTILNAPMTWGWNRNENNSLTINSSNQDYTILLTDFSFLEKATLTDTSGNVFEVLDVYNTAALGKANANKKGRPNAISVNFVSYGSSVTLRFMGIPDQTYTVLLTYQKLVLPFTATSQSWTIPDQYLDIYNNLFVGEAMAVVDDARANQYRQRGIATLLAKAEGLTEMQKDQFLMQYWSRDSQMLANQLRTQQANQARGI